MFRMEDLSRPTPNWLTPYVLPLAAVSGVGLAASLFLHVEAIEHKYPASMGVLAAMHLGVFIVFFPAVIIANRRAGYRRRKYAWEFVLSGSPWWMRYGCYLCGFYAALNGAALILEHMWSEPSGAAGAPSLSDWRGISAIWMGFYSVALAVLLAARKRMAD